MRRVAVKYTGRVQGVGFRATAHHLARPLDVVGWVRNEPDGSVSLEAQGDESEVARLLESIQETAGHLISGVDRCEVPLVDDQGFQIRY